MITSGANAQLKNITLLMKNRKSRREQGLFVVEGRKMFLEAQGLSLVEKAFVSESFFKENPEPECPYEVVSDSVFNSIAETVTPQGVIALVKIPTALSGEELKGRLETSASVVLLENLQDPGNLGTILRTAEASGMDCIILSADSVDVYNPKVVRSTMGAIFRVPIIYTSDFRGIVSAMNEMGYNTLATHLSAKKDYTEANYSGKTAVLIGNEGNGLTDETTALATEKIIIPMEGHAESLNASVAAALMMYEVKRHKNK